MVLKLLCKFETTWYIIGVISVHDKQCTRLSQYYNKPSRSLKLPPDKIKELTLILRNVYILNVKEIVRAVSDTLQIYF